MALIGFDPPAGGADHYRAAFFRQHGDIRAALIKHGLYEDETRIRGCFGYTQCRSPYCNLCASRRAWQLRWLMLRKIRALVQANSRYQVWFVTATAEDSPDVRSSARAVEVGFRRLLKHPRLKGRVVAYGAAVEVEKAHGRTYPCAHIHAVVVTRPMDKGKYRISKKDLIEIWEDVCPLHRLRRPDGKQPSIVMQLVADSDRDRKNVIWYCTKMANRETAWNHYHQLLTPDPSAFVERSAALKRTTRYFGGLCKKPDKRHNKSVRMLARRPYASLRIAICIDRLSKSQHLSDQWNIYLKLAMLTGILLEAIQRRLAARMPRGP